VIKRERTKAIRPRPWGNHPGWHMPC
jgi:hypothetical protein